MSTHNIYFHGKIRKILCGNSFLPGATLDNCYALTEVDFLFADGCLLCMALRAVWYLYGIIIMSATWKRFFMHMSTAKAVVSLYNHADAQGLCYLTCRFCFIWAACGWKSEALFRLCGSAGDLGRCLSPFFVSCCMEISTAVNRHFGTKLASDYSEISIMYIALDKVMTEVIIDQFSHQPIILAHLSLSYCDHLLSIHTFECLLSETPGPIFFKFPNFVWCFY